MRKIIHLDLDCFYAAVEEKHNPSLQGKAVAVGGSPQSRGVVATANYKARTYGVKAAVPSSRAIRLCPQLILVPPHFALYKQESAAIQEIFGRYTHRIEPLSLDEAYLDVTEVAQAPGEATRIAREIKAAVWKERQLKISAGVAPNKFLAKVASDWKKPDGLFVIPPPKVAEFVVSLPISKIYGVGPVTAKKMHELGIHTCGDLQNLSLFDLKRNFGSRAMDYFHLSRGEDDRPVDNEGERKSLSVEETFSADLATWDQICEQIPPLYQDWKERLIHQELANRVVGAVVKLKYSDFKSTTHEETSKSFPQLETFERLVQKAWSKRPEPIRLLGLGSKIASAESIQTSQLSLLEC